jgi:cell division protein FtsX
MRKTKLVFSLVKDQSLFMTTIMSLLTFLAVLAFGISISIGNGARRWNSGWDLFATVQVLSQKNEPAALKILSDNSNKFSSQTEISKSDMKKMLGPWISGDVKLDNYLPKMFEIKFKNKSDIPQFEQLISQHAKFLTHTQALKSSIHAGWQMIFISLIILLLTLGAIGVCISYIAKNTAMLHSRELEILNQIGAKTSFIAKQMQIIVAKICMYAGAIGFITATPVILMILAAAHSSRVGLMAMIGLGTFGWILLMLIPIAIIIFAIWMTKKTTLSILEKK